MIGEVIERCPTGIPGYDRLCQGGFVRNSDNLVIGGPGSGKSTFLLQFLWNGLTKYNENGLYISFEPDIVETLEDARSFGWDFMSASMQGRIKFMRFAPQTAIKELKNELKKVVTRNNIQRVCFDPVSIMALNQTDQGKIRQAIFELSSLMKRMKVTTVFSDESLEGESMQSVIEGEWTKTDILRFLSDSVTILYETGITGKGERAIRIMKMRRTKHQRKPVGMNITEKGLEILDEEGNKVSEDELENPKAAPETVTVQEGETSTENAPAPTTTSNDPFNPEAGISTEAPKATESPTQTQPTTLEPTNTQNQPPTNNPSV